MTTRRLLSRTTTDVGEYQPAGNNEGFVSSTSLTGRRVLKGAGAAFAAACSSTGDANRNAAAANTNNANGGNNDYAVGHGREADERPEGEYR